MRWEHSIALLAASALLAGCSGPLYAPQPAPAGLAKLEVEVASHDLRTDVWIFLDDGCQSRPGAGRLVQMPPGLVTRSYEIEAGRPLYLRAFGANPSRERLACIAMMRLTPRAGATYRLTHRNVSLRRPGQAACFDLADADGRWPAEAQPISGSALKDSCLMNRKRWED